MPPFQGKLSDGEASELASFVRSFSTAAPRPAASSQEEFDRRFQQLMEELNRLKRQYQALSQPARQRDQLSMD